MLPSILDHIKSYKRTEIAARKQKCGFAEIEQMAKQAGAVRAFDVALANAANAQAGFGLIAEIKKASPSKGVIRADFSPPHLARAYEAGGAHCLSVLTDAPSFQGDDQFLREARLACRLPILRKDFMLDPYQVIEARALGADCILLIMAMLSDDEAQSLEAVGFEYGMQVLLEVHNEQELARGLSLKSRLIGINNRDLHSFKVSLEVTKRLVKHIPPDYQVVAESGISTHDDMCELADAGVRLFLVGESLMRQSDVQKATRLLLEGEGRHV